MSTGRFRIPPPRMRMPEKPLLLGLVQLNANPDDEDRWPRTEEAIRYAARRGAQLIVLPELFATSYLAVEMDAARFALAEPVPGPTSQRCAALAAELGVVLVASVFEAAAPGLAFNTALVFDTDGTMLGRYRKEHIPDDPLYYEKFYFTPGGEGDGNTGVFDTAVGRIGVRICWDQWFPEAARISALRGAEVIVYPTAIGTIEAEGPEEHARQMDAWKTVQRGHAVANGVFVAACNRVGDEGPLSFWGQSFIAGPQGEVLAEASASPTEAGAEVIVVPLERGRLREVREMWPFFRDRRIERYGPLQRRWLGDTDASSDGSEPGRSGTAQRER